MDYDSKQKYAVEELVEGSLNYCADHDLDFVQKGKIKENKIK